MSLPISVGDLLAIIEVANKLRKRLSDAPTQYKAISEDIRGLSIILMDTEVSADQLPDTEKVKFQQVFSTCSSLLHEFELVLKKYYDIKQSTESKVVKGLWKRLTWEPDDIRDLRDRINTQVSILNTLNHQVVRQGVTKLISHQEDQQRQALLNWISEIDSTSQQNDLVSRRQPDSRKWLFASQEYSRWISEKRSILFCPGMPGAGKTISLAVVIEDLQRRFRNDPNTITSYLYCSYRNRDRDVTDLLSALLRSILQQKNQVPDKVMSVYHAHRTRSKRLSRESVKDLLRFILSGFTRVNILVDALDELPSDVRKLFTSEILRLHVDCGVNLFLTSRDIPQIQRPFSDYGALVLEIKASDEDVRSYLNDHIDQLRNFVSRRPDLQQEIINAITVACDGMFLLAELHLKSLKGKTTPGAIRNALKTLATGSAAYDDVYEKAMTRIKSRDSDSEASAKRTLLIITCAKRPLMTEELACALSVDSQSDFMDRDNIPEIEDIVENCDGLVTIDIQSNITRLVHKSTQEYFERTKSRWFPDANRQMALLCDQYLALVRSSPEYLMNENPSYNIFPFGDYASKNWANHTRAANQDDASASETTISSQTADQAKT